MVKKIKILFLIGSYGTGGKERQLAELIKGLDANLFEFHLLIKSDGAHYLDDVLPKLSSFHNFNRHRFGWKAYFEIRKAIKTIKPDIIHSWADVTSFYAIISKWTTLHAFKLIDGSIRTAEENVKFTHKLFRVFLNQFSESIIANSKAGLAAYQVPKLKSTYIYNGFDFRRLSNLTQKEIMIDQFGLNGYFIVGMVARFDPQKDWNTFIKTAINLHNKTRDIAFICVGGGPDLANLQLQIPKDYMHRIIFTGIRTDVESIINTFDIAVLLSNNKEGISNSITEYMSLGKVVIANVNGGNGELIQNEDLGILIQESNEKLLEETIFTLKNDDEKRKFISQNAKNHIKQNFSIDQMISNYSKTYHRLLCAE